jgi:predicted GNAT family N-acyltransferase
MCGERKITVVNGAKVQARMAVSLADRLAAFRLRYEVYIAEQGKPYSEADHENRVLSDELDPDGEIVVVTNGTSEVVGTVRANWFDSPRTRARYEHVFELSRFSQVAPAEIAACSRLAASLAHRQSAARELLFDTIYDRGLIRNTKLCFAACAPPLVRVFRGYGFREYAEPIRDSVAGILHRTVLVLDDLDYLQRITSPFISIASRHSLQAVNRGWLNSLFEAYKAHHAAC